MQAEIIDGRAIAKGVREDVKCQAKEFLSSHGRKPSLAVVLLGDNPASKVYVSSKGRYAKKCGIETIDVRLSAGIAESELHENLRSLSKRADVDGILLQLPLPHGLDEFVALQCIDPSKDVDGLHPLSQGLLMHGVAGLKPCTPSGCLLLAEKGLELTAQGDFSGKTAVVIGRSMLVGKPLGLLLLEKNCTVTYAHSKTKDLKSLSSSADILILAVGRPNFADAKFCKPGAIVIDVGINRLRDNSIVGDADFYSISQVAGAITPVPGGVGPMTIAMLLSNTLKAATFKT